MSEPNTLAEHFAEPILGPLIQMKGLFKKQPHVSLLSALFSGVAVFQQGAVVGRATTAQCEIIAKLLTTSGMETEACSALVESAKKAVDDYGREPESFIKFFTKVVGPPQFASYDDLDVIKELDKEQARLGMVLGWMDVWFLSGIGLGIAFPELVAKMWKNSYESTNPIGWEQARQAGLNIPEHYTAIPIEEMEQVALLQLAEYAQAYMPEVIGPLGFVVAKSVQNRLHCDNK